VRFTHDGAHGIGATLPRRRCAERSDGGDATAAPALPLLRPFSRAAPQAAENPTLIRQGGAASAGLSRLACCETVEAMPAVP
jgi:hypothetical protein